MEINKGIKNGNQFWQISFEGLPTNVDMLSKLPEANLMEPHYTAALLITALCVWPTDPNTSIEMMNFIKGPQALSNREIQFIKDRFSGKEYLPFSYFEGSSPENGYEPSKPFVVTITSVPSSFIEPDQAKLYLKSSGADSPRPVQLRRKPSSGEWFLWDQMLLAGIRIPTAEDPWA